MAVLLFTYDQLHQQGRIARVDLDRLAETLGITDTHMKELIARIFVNTSELAVNLRTYPFMQITKIPFTDISDTWPPPPRRHRRTNDQSGTPPED